MKKKINIVMLPTEDTKSKVWRNNSTDKLFYFEKTPNTIIRNTYTPQHLYFLSDEEIKEGDWYFNSNTKTILKAKANNVLTINLFRDRCKKIIATTDESLEIVSKGINPVYERLPRPSDDFLKRYCELGGIDECLVEYEDISYPNLEEEIPQPKKYKLKVAPDNTITVKPIGIPYYKGKGEHSVRELESFCEQYGEIFHQINSTPKNYTREEVENLIRNAVAESHDWSGENNNIHSIGIIEKRFLNDWIKENL